MYIQYRVGILDEAETARCLLHAVETHYNPLHLSTHREEFVNLLFAAVERHVAYVQCCTVGQLLLVFLRRQL